jgi:hypothetical protein
MFGKKTAAEAGWEARATELSPRGMPYSYYGRDFLPGIWQPITDEEWNALRFSVLELRKRGVKDGT